MTGLTVEKNTTQSFYNKYKKWILALVGIHLIPTLFVTSIFLGTAIYIFINNDINWHPYKSYIRSGFHAGHGDGIGDRSTIDPYEARGALAATPWEKYDWETRKIEIEVMKEKAQYLAEFSQEQKNEKLIEMKMEGKTLPLEAKLKKRFKYGIEFYAALTKQLVKREAYNSEKAYQQALRDTAWKLGYSFGYYSGLSGDSYRSGLLSLKG